MDRLKRISLKLESAQFYEKRRRENFNRLKELFTLLALDEKVESFEALFEFKAINLLGITLTPEALGVIQKKRYVQILAIRSKKERKGNDNLSLGYYGKSEALDEVLRERIVEFILRWRFEKSFYHVEFYRDLIEQIEEEHYDA